MAETPEYLELTQDLESLHLRRPLGLIGFGGWIDAGLAATGAIQYLVDELGAERVARLDPEMFYCFTDTRPRVSIGEPGERVATWPRAEWFVARMPDDVPHDLVLFSAPEPNLRWRAFTDVVLDVFGRLGTETFVSFGAVLAPIHYRAKPPLRGWATTDVLRTALRRRRISSGNYQGPTGITTVLLTTARARGLSAFSLSTSSPSYLPEFPNPRASVALLQGVADIGGIRLPLAGLERQARDLVARVDESLVEQPDLREAVERLPYEEEEEPEPPLEIEPRPALEGELPSPSAVLEDLESFLRQLRSDNPDAS